jgi:hypothetical protein
MYDIAVLPIDHPIKLTSKIVANIGWNIRTMLDIVPLTGQVLLETCRTTTLLRALAILANKSG